MEHKELSPKQKAKVGACLIIGEFFLGNYIFSFSGLLTISIHVSHNCPMSSQLAFEDTARQPVHKGDEDY